MSTGREVGLRHDERFPAASVVKLAIMLEAFCQARAGELSLDETYLLNEGDRVGGAGILLELDDGHQFTWRELIRLMIVLSDNIASNALLDRAAAWRVNRLMERLGMGESRVMRRFMEPAAGERDNWMSARDAGRCLAALWSGEALDEPYRSEALEILRRQQYREKIPCMLPASVPVAHKTGELDGIRHDAAVVEHPTRPYVLVLFTREGGPAWEVDAALARLSRAVFEQVEAGT